jgi:voltage-gated sodium channel type X alpha
MNTKPRLALIRPENKFRQIIYDIASNPKFNNFMMLIVILNTIVLGYRYSGMAKETEDIVQTVNHCFTLIFLLEAILKLIAFSSRYFLDPWNVLDFILVLCSITSLSYHQYVADFRGNSSTTSMVARTLKMGRLIKLVKGMKRL